MNSARVLLAAFFIAALAPSGFGQQPDKKDSSAEAAEPSKSAQEETSAAALLEKSFLQVAENVQAGKELWDDTCRHCHGRSAYPGKAPKLRPRAYTPEFVYDRVTNGFRKMPPWKDVYSDEERAKITAYILSPRFSP